MYDVVEKFAECLGGLVQMAADTVYAQAVTAVSSAQFQSELALPMRTPVIHDQLNLLDRAQGRNVTDKGDARSADIDDCAVKLFAVQYQLARYADRISLTVPSFSHSKKHFR
nr:hypothetical protein [Thiomicrorhabdus xiamenensis]